MMWNTSSNHLNYEAEINARHDHTLPTTKATTALLIIVLNHNFEWLPIQDAVLQTKNLIKYATDMAVSHLSEISN